MSDQDTMERTRSAMLVDLEVRILETWLDIPHCENAHTFPGNAVCSHVVTHCVVIPCGKLSDAKVCENAATSLSARGDLACAGCDRAVRECWVINAL